MESFDGKTLEEKFKLRIRKKDFAEGVVRAEIYSSKSANYQISIDILLAMLQWIHSNVD